MSKFANQIQNAAAQIGSVANNFGTEVGKTAGHLTNLTGNLVAGTARAIKLEHVGNIVEDVTEIATSTVNAAGTIAGAVADIGVQAVGGILSAVFNLGRR